mgnify:CR=1 FL=1
MLREISLLWSMLHALVLFFMLFETRFSKRKTTVITLLTMLPLIAVNTVLTFILNVNTMGVALLVTLSLPSMIVFLILAKNRDGRFFFTFCFVDTMVLELIYITQILNSFISPDTNLFMFFSRLLIFPALGWLVYKYFRNDYLNVQRHTKAGWGLFAVIGALFYVLITLTMSYPTLVIERPEYLPTTVLLLALIPVIYIHLLSTVHRLQKLHEMTEQEDILSLQVSNLTARMSEYSSADERFRVERHNFRHKLKTIASLIKTEQYEECLILLSEYEEALDKTRIKRYCQHTVLDAVLSSYIRKAQEKGIRLDLGFAFPDTLPVSETELATAIANALENALNACEAVEPEKRFIEIKVLSHPRFMLRIANRYVGVIEFDEDDIPVNHHEDHGFGTRFIAAFCHKHNGFYQFSADGEIFTLYLNF